MSSPDYLQELAAKYKLSSFNLSSSSDSSIDESTEFSTHDPSYSFDTSSTNLLSPINAHESKQSSATSTSNHSSNTLAISKMKNPLKSSTKPKSFHSHASGSSFSAASIIDLQNKIRSLEANEKLLQNHYNQQVKDLQNQIKQLQNEPKSSIPQSNLTLNLSLTEQLKTDLSTDLLVSESIYYSYKSTPTEQQSVKQYLAVKIYELNAKLQEKCSSLAVENSNLNLKLAELKNNYDLTQFEKNEISKTKNQIEFNSTENYNLLEKKYQLLKSEYSSKILEFERSKLEFNNFSSVKAERELLAGEVDELKKQNLIQASNLSHCLENEAKNKTQLEVLNKQIDLLNKDKMYLETQNRNSMERMSALEKSESKLVEKLDQVKKARNELTEKLMNFNLATQTQSEEKFNLELLKLKKTTEVELDSIRNSQKATYESEIRMLKETKNEMKGQLEKYEIQLQQQREFNDTLQADHRELLTTVEKERLNHLNSLKMKDFEYERLGLTFEETMTEFRKLKSDFELVNKKNSVLRIEFSVLEGQFDKYKMESKLQLKQAEDKLEVYTQLEYELDHAILTQNTNDTDTKIYHSISRLSSHTPTATTTQNANLAGISRILDSIDNNTMNAPNKRRFKQSLLLAQQLVDKQKLLDQSQAQLVEKEQEICDLKFKLQETAKHLELMNQPQQYLITTFRSKEDELRNLKAENLKLVDSLTGKQSELTHVREINMQLENDLKTLLTQKTHLTDLSALLAKSNSGSSSFSANNPAHILSSINKNAQKQVQQNKENEDQRNNSKPHARGQSNPHFQFPSTAKSPQVHVYRSDEGALQPIWFRK